MPMVEAVEEFRAVHTARPSNEAGQNYASWLGAVGMAFGEYSLAKMADMTPERCGPGGGEN